MPRPPRARRPALAIAVALAAACVSGLPLRAQSPPLGFEGVTLLANGHHVYARLAGLPEGAAPRWVEAAILPPAGACAQPSPPLACDPDAPRAVARAQTFPDGSLEFAFVTAGPFPRRPVRLRPAERVHLRSLDAAPWIESTATVAPLVIAPVDPVADRLTGTGPAGARLSVTANRPDGGFAFAQATVGADGAWSADLAGTLDLVPGAFGAVSTAVDGTVTQASWSVPRAVVRLGDPTVAVYARSGDVVTVAQECSGDDDRLGHGVVWRGASEPAPIALRLRRSGSLAAPSSSTDMCGAVTFGVDGAPDTADIQLPVDLAIDVAADVIRSEGRWPPGTFAVNVGGVRRTVETTAADTRWTLPLAGTVDLTTTLPVDVVSLDDTATIGWSMRAYPWQVDRVDPAIVRVHGRGIAGHAVQLATGDDLIGVGTVAADGTFDITAYDANGVLMRLGSPIDLTISDFSGARQFGPGEASGDPPLEATRATSSTFVAAPLIAAALANRDVVNGTALPGARLHVRVGDERNGTALDVAAGDDGRWEADFTDLADLVPGMPVTVEATASDGYRSSLSFPVFRASAQVGGDRVVIEGHPGLEVAVEASRAGATIGRGGCTVPDGMTTCTARVRDAVLGAIPLAGGDEVVVLPSVGASASLTLFAFAAHIDTNAFSVVGNCPPNGTIQVRFHAAEGAAAPFDSATTADSNGVCDYELSRSEWELVTPGLTADLIHALPGGHRLFSTGVYEQVRVTNNGPVEGLAEPFAPVTLTLRTAAGVDHPPTTLRADGDGRWAADASLTPRAPGETLIVDDGRKHHAIPHTPLVGWWFDRLGAVAGVTGPDQLVKVIHHIDPAQPRPMCGGPSEYTVVADIADPAGTFALDAPPIDACAAGQAELAAVLVNGDEVRYRLPTDVVPGGRVFLPVGVAGE